VCRVAYGVVAGGLAPSELAVCRVAYGVVAGGLAPSELAVCRVAYLVTSETPVPPVVDPWSLGNAPSAWT
jgi:hypothetical protein